MGDKNGDERLSENEFVEALLFLPLKNMEQRFEWAMLQYIHPFEFNTTRANNREPLASMVIGGLAGAISRTCTAPLERIKTIIQTRPNKRPILFRFRQIYREEGFWAYFKGNGTLVLKIFPETAIRFFVFELFTRKSLK